MNQVNIKINHEGVGSLEINGMDVSRAVRGFGLSAEAGRATQMQVILVPGSAVFEGKAEVSIDFATAAVLKAAGWRSPDEVAGIDFATAAVLKAAGWRSPDEVADPLGLTDDQRRASQMNEVIGKIQATQ